MMYRLKSAECEVGDHSVCAGSFVDDDGPGACECICHWDFADPAYEGSGWVADTADSKKEEPSAD